MWGKFAAILVLLLAVAGCRHEVPEYESRYTSPPPEPTRAQVAVIGDSFTGGSKMGGNGQQGWPHLVETQLNQQQPAAVAVAADGGSGYVADGEHTGRVFADQIPRVVAPGDEVVVLFGSLNDRDVPAPQLSEAVAHTLSEVRAAAPDAKLIVIGPPLVNTDHEPGIYTVRDVLQEQTAAAGATFIDPIAEGWLTPEMIGPDGVHPTDAGHRFLADKIGPLIAQQMSL